MGKIIKKFENFSADLKDKSKEASHGSDENDNVNKELTLDKFRKIHKYLLGSEWDERDHDKVFTDHQKDLEKYRNLSDSEKQKYLDKLDFSDSTSLK